MIQEYRIDGINGNEGMYQGTYEDIKDFDKRVWEMKEINEEKESKWLNVKGEGKFGPFNYHIKIR